MGGHGEGVTSPCRSGWVLEEPGFSLTDEQRARVRTAGVLLLNLTGGCRSREELTSAERGSRSRNVSHVAVNLGSVPESVSSCSGSVCVGSAYVVYVTWNVNSDRVHVNLSPPNVNYAPGT